MADFKLYNYFRSSAAYRVRIALNLKNLKYDYIPVHLAKDGGQQHQAQYKEINPSSEVPTLIHKGTAISQSMAIIQYLDEVWPTPALFPKDPLKKAQVLDLCELVNSGIHPIQNLKVLKELDLRFQCGDSGRQAWAAHWIEKGFAALEKKLAKTAGLYAFGDEITAADLFIVPQFANAIRFKAEINSFTKIKKIEENCNKLEAFKKAHPSQQPDAE